MNNRIIPFLVIVALGVFYKWDAISPMLKPAPDYQTMQSHEVTLYTTVTCGYCKKTRKLLDDKGVVYIDNDIEESASARKEWKSLGGRGVPVVVIDGQVIKGYNPNKIIQLLSSRP